MGVSEVLAPPPPEEKQTGFGINAQDGPPWQLLGSHGAHDGAQRGPTEDLPLLGVPGVSPAVVGMAATLPSSESLLLQAVAKGGQAHVGPLDVRAPPAENPFWAPQCPSVPMA